MISHFGNAQRLPNMVGYGQPFVGRGQISGPPPRGNVMREGLGHTRFLGDIPGVDAIGSFIQNQASQGATQAVQPYIMGALALGAGALLISLVALSNSKKGGKSLSGSRRR